MATKYCISLKKKILDIVEVRLKMLSRKTLRFRPEESPVQDGEDRGGRLL